MYDGTIEFHIKTEENGYLSNFYMLPRPLSIDGLEWYTTEHYYQAQKFVDTDLILYEKIRSTKSAYTIWELANVNSNKMRDDWNWVKVRIMEKALYAKFTQSEDLQERLLATNNSLIIERTENDYFWGKNRKDEGLNFLGMLLMNVRKMINLEMDINKYIVGSRSVTFFTISKEFSKIKIYEANTKYGKLFGLLNKNGIILTKPIFVEVEEFGHNLLRVENIIDLDGHERHGLYNKEGQIILPCEYRRIEDFENEFSLMYRMNYDRLETSTGVINFEGKIIVPANYDSASPYADTIIVTKYEKSSEMIDDETHTELQTVSLKGLYHKSGKKLFNLSKKNEFLPLFSSGGYFLIRFKSPKDEIDWIYKIDRDGTIIARMGVMLSYDWPYFIIDGSYYDDWGDKLVTKEIYLWPWHDDHRVEIVGTAEEEKIYFCKNHEKYGGFSNFSDHSIIVNGLEWPSVEHFYQGSKFNEETRKELIRATKPSSEAKKMGNEKGFPIRSDWEEIKEKIMYEALLVKFTQHEGPRELLFSTRESELIEDNKYDDYWGIGKENKGKNRMGKLLMDLRVELLNTFINFD